jgi:hypothetical protein
MEVAARPLLPCLVISLGLDRQGLQITTRGILFEFSEGDSLPGCGGWATGLEQATSSNTQPKRAFEALSANNPDLTGGTELNETVGHAGHRGGVSDHKSFRQFGVEKWNANEGLRERSDCKRIK